MRCRKGKKRAPLPQRSSVKTSYKRRHIFKMGSKVKYVKVLPSLACHGSIRSYPGGTIEPVNKSTPKHFFDRWNKSPFLEKRREKPPRNCDSCSRPVGIISNLLYQVYAVRDVAGGLVVVVQYRYSSIACFRYAMGIWKVCGIGDLYCRVQQCSCFLPGVGAVGGFGVVISGVLGVVFWLGFVCVEM